MLKIKMRPKTNTNNIIRKAFFWLENEKYILLFIKKKPLWKICREEIRFFVKIYFKIIIQPWYSMTLKKK